MIKTFTQNDVIRFVYDEVSTEERCEIGSLLKNDYSVLYFYNNYNGMKNLIQKASLEPSDSVINCILNYSKSFSLHQ